MSPITLLHSTSVTSDCHLTCHSPEKRRWPPTPLQWHKGNQNADRGAPPSWKPAEENFDCTPGVRRSPPLSVAPTPCPVGEGGALCKLRLHTARRGWREEGRERRAGSPRQPDREAPSYCSLLLDTAKQSSLLHSNCQGPVCGLWTKEAGGLQRRVLGPRLHDPPISSPHTQSSLPHCAWSDSQLGWHAP